MKIQKKKKFWRGGGGVRVDVNEELNFLMKIQKKIGGGGRAVRGGVGLGGGGQGGCERRIEFFVKIKKKLGGGGSGGRGRVWGLRVDVIEELKFLRKFTKTILGGGRGLGRGWVGLVGGSGWM